MNDIRYCKRPGHSMHNRLYKVYYKGRLIGEVKTSKRCRGHWSFASSAGAFGFTIYKTRREATEALVREFSKDLVPNHAQTE